MPVSDSTTLNGANSGSSDRVAASSGSLQVLSAACDDTDCTRVQAPALDTIPITTDSYAAAVRAVNSPANEPEKIEDFQVMTISEIVKRKPSMAVRSTTHPSLIMIMLMPAIDLLKM